MAIEPQIASCVEVSWPALMRLVDLVRRAGAAILDRAGCEGELKPDGTPVTPADLAAQEIICAELREWDPSVPIVAEESPLPEPAARTGWTRYWLVDPLDGTKEFLAGRPDFTVNIALIEQATPVLGVVGAPAMATVYWAGRGLGAWRQEGQDAATRLRRQPRPPDEGVRIVESRSHPSPDMEPFIRRLRVSERLQVGSSLKFCSIAEDRADCYPRFGPMMAWDVAAGDCVYRCASPGLTPFPSPLSYDPLNLRQPAFVIGFGFGAEIDGDRLGDVGPAVIDPDAARSAATAAGVIVHRDHPLNGETPLARLVQRHDATTPTNAFFIRCHTAIPDLPASTFCLHIGGLVEHPMVLSLDDLKRYPAHRRTLTLECAGNGRALLAPGSGEPWTFGAVGTAAWTGVRLTDVLARVGPRSEAREVIFRGCEVSETANGQAVPRFERSLRLDQVRATDPLLAYAMNDAQLTPAHGAPLRLVVPGWYGMAWVKWLTEIELTADAFAGFYQAERYRYDWARDIASEPVTRQRVRALILSPTAGDTVSRHELLVEGIAWSGEAAVAAVDVAVDDGPWQRATLAAPTESHGWRRWSVRLDVSEPGPVLLRARARDHAGRVQPARAEWNRHGYGNNQIHAVFVLLT